MDQPVVIEYRTGQLSGARYVIVSAAKAAEVHPEAEIVGYEDGSPYEAGATKPKKRGATTFREIEGEEPVDWAAVRTFELLDDGTSREVRE